MKNVLLGLGLCAATLLGSGAEAEELNKLCNKNASANSKNIVRYFNDLKKCLKSPNAAKAVEDCSLEIFDVTDSAILAGKIAKNCKPLSDKFNDCTSARGYNAQKLEQEVKEACPASKKG